MNGGDDEIDFKKIAGTKKFRQQSNRTCGRLRMSYFSTCKVKSSIKVRATVPVKHKPRVRAIGPVKSKAKVRSYGLMTTNQLYTLYNVQLSNTARARTVAQGYQLYRIKKITIKFSPLLDTFAAGAPIPTSVPYLYCMIDRTRNLQAANSSSALKTLGAVPRRLDDKVITFSFKPSVLNAAYDSNPPAGQGRTQFVQYRVSPWLNTRDWEDNLLWKPDSTDHLGCVFYAESSVGSTITYKCEIQMEFEFKKPSYQLSPYEGEPAPIDLESLHVAGPNGEAEQPPDA